MIHLLKYTPTFNLLLKCLVTLLIPRHVNGGSHLLKHLIGFFPKCLMIFLPLHLLFSFMYFLFSFYWIYLRFQLAILVLKLLFVLLLLFLLFLLQLLLTFLLFLLELLSLFGLSNPVLNSFPLLLIVCSKRSVYSWHSRVN